MYFIIKEPLEPKECPRCKGTNFHSSIEQNETPTQVKMHTLEIAIPKYKCEDCEMQFFDGHVPMMRTVYQHWMDLARNSVEEEGTWH